MIELTDDIQQLVEASVNLVDAEESQKEKGTCSEAAASDAPRGNNDDDMLSLRNFYVNIITFWSSRGNLSSKKSKKTEEKDKDKIVARLVKNVT